MRSSEGDREVREISLDELKSLWNQILDLLLESDRIAWLAFFDARLVRLTSNVLTINFSDVTKFGGEHNFSAARNPQHLGLLQKSIKEIAGIDLEIVEE